MSRRVKMAAILIGSQQLCSGPKLAYTTARQNLPSSSDLSGKISKTWILKQISIGAHLLSQSIRQAMPTYLLTESFLRRGGKYLNTQKVPSQADGSSHNGNQNAHRARS